MPSGQMTNVTATIYNAAINTVNITNLLSKRAYSNELVIVKLKQKLESSGYVFFESVRPNFLNKILNYLKNNNYLCQDVLINT